MARLNLNGYVDPNADKIWLILSYTYVEDSAQVQQRMASELALFEQNAGTQVYELEEQLRTVTALFVSRFALQI